MGFLDRFLQAITPELVDPNPELSGTPARAVILDEGNYSEGSEGDHVARWSAKELTVRLTGAADSAPTKLLCHLGSTAHKRATVGVEVPVLLDASGLIIGLDVAAWEAEASTRVALPPIAGAAVGPTIQPEFADAGAGLHIEGVDFEQWVTVEVALARELVDPAHWDSRATQLGVPAGRWQSIQAEWGRRMRNDPKLAARFGTEYQARVSSPRGQNP